ncbi:aminotransferase class V-fold PLP-dependent enzyme [Methanoregula sp.]|uniref:aminotransferase class V-fold PLP-dependent enzyme n=1 Tax=Methanoregula sp. TaxID=2052170 RepID=UPI0026398E0A|nr:aminotransferase class V-fold PLP-dependent enzyme [Methanoregula sp.]MDD5144146.1 aminotransferase class V-fold PLP-dependent enzyme [Methanoregula sp.]
MLEPPVKKVLYWCEECNVPLIAKSCACGREGKRIELLQPYELRPALSADHALIRRLVQEQFGDIPVAKVLLLNKTGGVDRADLVLMHGERFGWLTFDPVKRRFVFDLAPEALPFIIRHATKGVLDLGAVTDIRKEQGRIGGKRLALTKPFPNGSVIVKYKGKYGTGVVKDGSIKVKELATVEPRTRPDPGWDVVIDKNRYHLKNLERNAVRAIKHHMSDRPTVNVSFSGGKDSTAVLHLARKAGVEKAFFIDTGLEFPETIAFVKSQGVEIVGGAGDFWQAVEKAGPPGKDNRWCCKFQKLRPLKLYLAKVGPCVTIQGNRWYESWNRASLEETSQNPDNPLQLNVSPIRNWRALEVFLYLWWQKVEMNPLYEQGIERIGCFLCPAMLESEYEQIRVTHPEYAKRWDDFVERWAAKKGMPEEYCQWGLWRWRALPKKMRELCREKGIAVNEDFTLKQTEPRKRADEMVDIGRERTMKAAMQEKPTDDLDVIGMRKDFPLVSEVIYFDNAATSLSPEPVIQSLVEFERNYRANVGRGVHRLTQIASQRYWHAHEKVAEFIGAKGGVTVFTKSSTESINMVAQGFPWKAGDRVLTTVLEHHANLLPWYRLRDRGVAVDFADIRDDYTFDLAAFESAITDRTRLVAITHASNVLGVITPVQEIAKICHDHGALLLVDMAQSVPHLPVDIMALGCDFAAFSGHKMLGPTGTGVLWMKEPVIEPLLLGGGIVESVTRSGYTLVEGYQRYEAGTGNIAGGIGLGVAVDYLTRLGMDRVRRHEQALTTRVIDGLKKIPRVTVYAPGSPDNRVGVISFTVEGLHPHEVAQRLDETADIMVRSGHHCCMPLMDRLGLPNGTVRASLGLYNTVEEADLFHATMEEILR